MSELPTKQIRNLGIFLTMCYLAVFLQVNRLTVFDAEDLQNRAGNTREDERDFDSPRGSISTADGVVLAQSVESADPDDPYNLQRVYPTGALFGHVTGFFNPLSVGDAGLERTYNDELAGRNRDINLNTIEDYVEDFFVASDHVGNLHLTLRNDVQLAAQQALGDTKGSVVVLDPRTGGIIALWSFPSYDPNPLAVHDRNAATLASQQLIDDPTNPRLARSYQEIFPPGSTFKIVTGTAGVESNAVTPTEPVYPDLREYVAPGASRGLPNFDSNLCGGALFEILARSCNTSFAQMGVEDVGGEGMTRTAQEFGFNQDVPIDLPSPAVSNFPVENAQDPALLAQISIGQNEVAATPLQMALVAAAVANAGEVMEPHVLDEIRDEDEEVIREYDPSVWTTPMSAQTAATMKEAMINVVENGSADALDDGIEDFEVGGKTGTAQIGNTGTSHAWIIGFAGPEGGEPEVAISVIVEGRDEVREQTGGRFAGPIAAQVLAAALTPIPAPGEEPDEGG